MCLQSTVHVVVGGQIYKSLEVPSNCTVGHWKQLLEEGFLGDKVLYAGRLICTTGESSTELKDDAELPRPPIRVHLEGPNVILKMLELALVKRLGPPTRAVQHKVRDVDTWEEVCRAVGAPIVHGDDSDGSESSSVDLDMQRLQRLSHFVDWLGSEKLDLNRFDEDELDVEPLAHLGIQRIGAYLVRRRLGQGLQGAVVYLGEHAQKCTRVAVKWPLKAEELAAWQRVQQHAPGALGLPELLEAGVFDGDHYAVTELLGADLTKVLPRLENQPFQRRWRAVRILGRATLRRLEVLHNCGLVHCDVSPYNILLGRARDGDGLQDIVPYLIDFGQARPCPGGGPVAPDQGTLEFSSARTAMGGERLREDDLEALGWTLIFLLFSGLPWMEWLEDWDDLPPFERAMQRSQVIDRVRSAKIKLLDVGWSSLGSDWKKLANIPKDLDEFMHTCRFVAKPPERPDYERLGRLLGAKPNMHPCDAERRDCRAFRKHVAHLL